MWEGGAMSDNALPCRDTTVWRPITECPDDFERPGGQRAWRMRDYDEVEFIGRRTLWNDTGWAEVGTNREKRPVEFIAQEAAPTPPR